MSDEPRPGLTREAAAAVSTSPDLGWRSRTSTCPSVPAAASKRAQVTVGELLQKSGTTSGHHQLRSEVLDEVIEKLDARGLLLRGRD